MVESEFKTMQDIIWQLQRYWAGLGCALLQPIDIEVGAATFHPATILRAISPEPWKAAYVQASRRPTDGRFGSNPNRCQHFYQFQVVIKPSPDNLQDLYLESLKYLDIDFSINDIRFIEDNWASPTLGAYGTGWEVRLNNLEITQYTYFQQIGKRQCRPVMGELAYGLERIAMHIQNVTNIYDIIWSKNGAEILTYGELFLVAEEQLSKYNFAFADVNFLFAQFNNFEKEVFYLIEQNLSLPAFELVLKSSHLFNLLDARKVLSIDERQRYILRIRKMSIAVLENYYQQRESLNFPLLKKQDR